MDNIRQVADRISDSLGIRGVRQKKAKRVSSKLKPLTLHSAEDILSRHTRDLLGKKPFDRNVYIMVTTPLKVDFSPTWVRKALRAGANLFRVNCSHDAVADWSEIIKTIRQMSSELEIPCRIFMDLAGPKIRTASPEPKKLSTGDFISLVAEIHNKKKDVLCSLPEALKFVMVGERVVFDDGKISAVVVGKDVNKVDLEIIRTPGPKVKLKREKGINFPDSLISVSEVTEQDLRDLEFAAVHADIIGLSFVQSPEAIRKIRREISARTTRTLGIVLKIETQAGFRELPKLLFEAMREYPAGVMIARGDLGVEVGFERMGEVQDEILWLCESAHVPVIWATQVLENQAKTGIPSRAEVTDAASSVRAECVMLNKGPFIDETIRSLDDILKRMEAHSHKKRSVYRKLKVAKLL